MTAISFGALDCPFLVVGEPKQEKMRTLGEIFRDCSGNLRHLVVCFLLKVRLYGTSVSVFSAAGGCVTVLGGREKADW